MSANRPKTIREMQAEKKKSQHRDTITVLNISNQLIKVHLNAPVINGKKLDFFVGAQDMNLTPGQSYSLPKNRVRMEQLIRLQKMQQISIIKETKDE